MAYHASFVRKKILTHIATLSIYVLVQKLTTLGTLTIVVVSPGKLAIESITI